MDKKIEVEFTSYGMCIITFPNGSEATMQGDDAAAFEKELEKLKRISSLVKLSLLTKN